MPLQLLPAPVAPSKGKQLISQTLPSRRAKCMRPSRRNAASQGCSQPRKRPATRSRSTTTTTKRNKSASQFPSKLAIDLELQTRSLSANLQSSNLTSKTMMLNTSLNQPIINCCTIPIITNPQNITPVSLPHFNHTFDSGGLFTGITNTTTSASNSYSCCSNSFSSSSAPSISSSLPIIIDPFSYITEVFDNIFAPQIIAQTPLLKSIRIVLIKKLLFDHANTELMTDSITCFEELHEFTLEIFRRTSLLNQSFS